MRLQGSTLIIPVENQVRELDAKLLLSCVAAERGFSVVLGSRFFIHLALPFLSRGVVIAKSMRSVSRLTLMLTRRLGHDIVAWDEEGLVRFLSPEYYAWRYSTDAFGTVSHLFTWGQDDANLFSQYPGYNGAPIYVTGNPRIDLLRQELRGYFQEEVEALQRKHGKFILVNTNFSFVNAFVPGLNLIQRTGFGRSTKVSRTGFGLSPEFAEGMANHQKAIYEAFRELVPQLGRWFPDKTIVLRPHPSEDRDVWRDVVADQQNVRVIHDGNVVPWLMACEVLVHNGCTTAVEAAMLKTPLITYQPVRSAAYDYDLPNSLSHRAFACCEVREKLDDVIRGRAQSLEQGTRQRILSRHLAPTTGALASDRVVDVLEHLGYLDHQPPRSGVASYLRGWIGLNARTLAQQINMQRSNSRHSAAHHAHRFPRISTDEINDRISKFHVQLNRFGNVRAVSMSPHIFQITGSATEPSAAENRPRSPLSVNAGGV